MPAHEDWEAVYVKYRDPVEQYVRWLFRGRDPDGSSPEDIAHQIFVELMLAGFPPSEIKLALLKRRTYWRAIDALRKARKVQPTDKPCEEKRQGEPPQAVPDGLAIARQQFIDELRVKLIRKHLDCLTPKQRYVLAERVAKGRPAKDVAEDLNVEPSRIAQLATAALIKLRKAIREEIARLERFEE